MLLCGSYRLAACAYSLIGSRVNQSTEKPGTHRGYGFVEFEEEKSAKDAVDSMNGFELCGRRLKVGWANSTGAPGQPTMGGMT